MNRLLAVSVAAAIGISVLGCKDDHGRDAKPAAGGSGTQQNSKDDKHGGAKDDVHAGPSHDLGTQQIGGFSVKANQIGAIKPGGEGVFEIAVTGGSGKPTAVRAWVGTESGEGSAKSKAEATEKDYDVHVELPAQIPVGSKLWVEVEAPSGKSKGSFALK